MAKKEAAKKLTEQEFDERLEERLTKTGRRTITTKTGECNYIPADLGDVFSDVDDLKLYFQAHAEDFTTFREYQRLAHTVSSFYKKGVGEEEISRGSIPSTTNDRAQLLMAALGVAGEAGEIADMIKKVVFHGHQLDTVKLMKEIGDVLWYLAETCTAIRTGLNEAAVGNLHKLFKRYEGGFSTEKSINRKE